MLNIQYVKSLDRIHSRYREIPIISFLCENYVKITIQLGILTHTRLKYVCINYGDQRVIFLFNPLTSRPDVHARIQIYWCGSSIFRHLKLELLTQFPASNDKKYINVVYIWRKFVSFYGYVHWRMTTEISVMYGSEKVQIKMNVLVSSFRFIEYLCYGHNNLLFLSVWGPSVDVQIWRL